MILTNRFGALAGRRDFSTDAQIVREREVDTPVHTTQMDERYEESAA